MHRLTLLIPLILILTVRADGAAAGLSMSITPTGELTLTMGQKPVASGHWGIMPPFGQVPQNQIVAGAVVSSTAVTESPLHATVTDTYAAAKATYEITVKDEDLHIAAHLENLDKSRPLTWIAFHGLTFHFSRPPDGNLHAWDLTYILQNGPSLFHPSSQTPLGVSFAHDDDFAFSAYSSSEFDQLSLFNAGWKQGGAIPAECEVQFFTPHQIDADKSLDVDVTFRVTSNKSIPHLMGAYKSQYDARYPKLLYKPEERPIAQFAAVDKSFITRSNPLGFGGAFRRLDSDPGTRAYVRFIAPTLQRTGMAGIIFWSPGGYYAPMYPPDFDQFPPEVEKNIPTLVDGFKKLGLRVGLCARCADGVTREQGKDPVIYRLSADDAEQMKVLSERFRHAMAMGFDMFYLDSMGNLNPNDLEILKKVRKTVGPDVPLYTEYCTDMTLPYAGHYCEWRKDGIAGAPPEIFQALRYLCPDSTWLCIDRTGQRRIPPEFEKLGLVPLVGDESANRLPATFPVENAPFAH